MSYNLSNDNDFRAALRDLPDQEFTKLASSEGSDTIRLRLRENGIQRHRVLPFQPIGDRTLIPHSTDDDYPYLIEEMEATQAGAVTVSMGTGSSELRPMAGNRFEVRFHANKTPTFWKNAYEFMTWKTDLKGLTLNNALLDLESQEDNNWFRVHNGIVGALNSVNSDGKIRHRGSSGGVTRAAWNTATQHFNPFMLVPGVYVVNKTTISQLQNLGRNDWGGDGAETNFTQGLKDMNPFGVPHSVTLKQEVVPNRTMFMYAPSNFLGRAFQMQGVQAYVKKEDNIVSVRADEIVGFAIANRNAIGKWTFGT